MLTAQCGDQPSNCLAWLERRSVATRRGDHSTVCLGLAVLQVGRFVAAWSRLFRLAWWLPFDWRHKAGQPRSPLLLPGPGGSFDWRHVILSSPLIASAVLAVESTQITWVPTFIIHSLSAEMVPTFEGAYFIGPGCLLSRFYGIKATPPSFPSPATFVLLQEGDAARGDALVQDGRGPRDEGQRRREEVSALLGAAVVDQEGAEASQGSQPARQDAVPGDRAAGVRRDEVTEVVHVAKAGQEEEQFLVLRPVFALAGEKHGRHRGCCCCCCCLLEPNSGTVLKGSKVEEITTAIL